jgi:hypothetical protein
MLISIAELKGLLRALDIAAAECRRAAAAAPSAQDSIELLRLLADMAELRRRMSDELQFATADPTGTVN